MKARTGITRTMSTNATAGTCRKATGIMKITAVTATTVTMTIARLQG
ncbi:MAG: hypothetical protein P4K80_05495 [Acidobacteriaceae bacterium]|nr:hypothetical protein [Acidobacteriaceae bacterium]